MKELSLKQKIAQMMLIEFQGKEVNKDLIDLIQKYKIGGIVLFRKNYDSYKQMLQIINDLKEASSKNDIPLFISLDQEGGRVNRMPFELTNIRNAELIASTGDLELVRASGYLTSKMLLGLGINLNYAPLLDIRRSEDDNHALGNRCFGRNKEDVSKYGIEVMSQMQKQGVLPAVKHFPGHGATLKDSHFILPVVDMPKEELENDDMVPFKNAIENGADAIMVGHIVVKDIDPKHPASLSKELIQKYLIDKYNFKGLIMTDDLKMLSIKLRYSRKRAVKLAINAGNNMVIIGTRYKNIIKLINSIAREVVKGNIDSAKIDSSVQKIIDMKKKYNLSDNKVEGINIEEMNAMIKELNDRAEKQSSLIKNK